MTTDLRLGDCLDVLPAVPDGEAALVYMDPPFFAQRDFGAFDDRWSSQADYLAFMEARLREVRRVLRADGWIFVHCDASAGCELKVTLNEVFGLARYKTTVIWRRNESRDGHPLGNICDMIHVFARGPEARLREVRRSPRPTGSEEPTKRVDKRGTYRLVTLCGPGSGDGSSESSRPWRDYDPKTFGRSGRQWHVPRTGAYGRWIDSIIPGYSETLSVHARLDLLAEHDFIVTTRGGAGQPQIKRYEFDGHDRWMVDNLWDDIPRLRAANSEGTGYPTQKPIALLARVLELGSDKGDLVLDPFMGSGTTGVAAVEYGRRFVGIDRNPEAVELAERRIRAAQPSLF